MLTRPLFLAIALLVITSRADTNIRFLNDVETADLIEKGQIVTHVTLTKIKAAMFRATWKSEDVINKGRHHLRIASGPDIFVSYYGGFFWVEGQNGCFVIDAKDRILFDRHFSQLLAHKIIPWREQNNSEQGAAANP